MVYVGNVLEEMERAIKAGHRGLTLTVPQMMQVLELNRSITEAKNELVRENHQLRHELRDYTAAAEIEASLGDEARDEVARLYAELSQSP